MTDPALYDPATNGKTTLVEFCQRYTARSMGKDDIVYTTARFEGQFQATVKVNCIDGQEYAGDMCTTAKEAEQRAAMQGVLGCATLVTKIFGEQPTIEEVPDALVKTQLRLACKEILARDLDEAALKFEYEEVTGGQQASLRLPSLPGELGNYTWVGGPSPYKRDAMLMACKQALGALLQDPLAAELDMEKLVEAKVRKDIEKKSSSSKTPSACGKCKAGKGGKGGKGGWGKGGGGATTSGGKGQDMESFASWMMEGFFGYMATKGAKGKGKGWYW